jgi:uncharacterized paraquat-inducible protein A
VLGTPKKMGMSTSIQFPTSARVDPRSLVIRCSWCGHAVNLLQIDDGEPAVCATCVDAAADPWRDAEEGSDVEGRTRR